jgi:hypothetical protein
MSRVRDLLTGRKEGGRTNTPADASAAAVPQATATDPQPSAQGLKNSRASADEYFERLDAAFAGLNSSTTSTASPIMSPQNVQPTPVKVSPSLTPISFEPPPAQPGGNRLADAFTALLAAEQAQPAVPAAPLTQSLSDAMIDEIARRVVARMGDDAMRQAVLQAAERLVREEIERIRRGRGSGA